jgi:hypothetical protein
MVGCEKPIFSTISLTESSQQQHSLMILWRVSSAMALAKRTGSNFIRLLYRCLSICQGEKDSYNSIKAKDFNANDAKNTKSANETNDAKLRAFRVKSLIIYLSTHPVGRCILRAQRKHLRWVGWRSCRCLQFCTHPSVTWTNPL